MEVFVAILLFIATMVQGGFFPTTYILMGILILIAIPFTLKKIPSFKLTIPFFLFCMAYLVTSFGNGALFDGLLSGIRPLICFLFFILLCNGNHREKLPGIIVMAGITAAALGLLAFCRVLPLQGANTAGRLQGTFQYANAAGIYLAACALTANSIKNKKWRNGIVILEAALILTQSVGSILSYLFGVAVCVWMSPKTEKLTVASEFGIRLFISAVFAGLIYAFEVILTLHIAAFIVLLALGVFSIKAQKAVDVLLKYWSAFFISMAGILAAGSLFSVVRGESAYRTYVERIIQISDGFKAMLSHPLLGFGPGVWENVRFAWQSADYDTGYIHSSVIQAGVDSGIFSLLILAVLIVVLFRSINYKNTYIFVSILIILLHSALDITLNFMSVNLLLLILCFLGTDTPVHGIGHRTLTAVSVLPLILFAYLLYGQLTYNGAVRSVKANDVKSAAAALEKLNTLHLDSYAGNIQLAKLYLDEGQYDKVHEQINRISYKTADMFYLEGQAYFREKRNKDAIAAAFKCIELSEQQAYGYELAREIIRDMPAAEQDTYSLKLDVYMSEAEHRLHPLAYVIEQAN